MKKLEASFINGLLRIVGQYFFKTFVSSSLEISHYSISLSQSWSLRVFSEHSSFGARKEKQEKGKEGKKGSRKKSKIKQLRREYL